jgi:hypothetical protein
MVCHSATVSCPANGFSYPSPGPSSCPSPFQTCSLPADRGTCPTDRPVSCRVSGQNVCQSEAACPPANFSYTSSLPLCPYTTAPCILPNAVTACPTSVSMLCNVNNQSVCWNGVDCPSTPFSYILPTCVPPAQPCVVVANQASCPSSQGGNLQCTVDGQEVCIDATTCPASGFYYSGGLPNCSPRPVMCLRSSTPCLSGSLTCPVNGTDVCVPSSFGACGSATTNLTLSTLTPCLPSYCAPLNGMVSILGKG